MNDDYWRNPNLRGGDDDGDAGAGHQLEELVKNFGFDIDDVDDDLVAIVDFETVDYLIVRRNYQTENANRKCSVTVNSY